MKFTMKIIKMVALIQINIVLALVAVHLWVLPLALRGFPLHVIVLEP